MQRILELHAAEGPVMNGTRKANATTPTIATLIAKFLRFMPQRVASRGVKFYT